MALFSTHKPPPESGILGKTFQSYPYEGGYPRTNQALGVYSDFYNYARNEYAGILGVSLNHYDDIRYSPYFDSFESGFGIQEPEADIPYLDRKYRGTRDHFNNDDFKSEILDSSTSTESLYFTAQAMAGYHKVMRSRPILKWGSSSLSDRDGQYERDIYHDKDGTWETKAEGRTVSIFRMVYTDSAGVGNEQYENVFLAFGSNGSHNTTANTTGKVINNKSAVPGGITSLNPLSNNHNTYVSNAGISIIFREYVHYVGNPLGGTGLIDLTPFSITATTYIERNMKTDIFSYYGDPETVDFENQVSPIKIWPKKHLTGLTGT